MNLMKRQMANKIFLYLYCCIFITINSFGQTGIKDALHWNKIVTGQLLFQKCDTSKWGAISLYPEPGYTTIRYFEFDSLYVAYFLPEGFLHPTLYIVEKGNGFFSVFEERYGASKTSELFMLNIGKIQFLRSDCTLAKLYINNHYNKSAIDGMELSKFEKDSFYSLYYAIPNIEYPNFTKAADFYSNYLCIRNILIVNSLLFNPIERRNFPRNAKWIYSLSQDCR